MESIESQVVSGGASSQSRREALARFGRYAAAAPAAMVLLQPRESFAGKSKTKTKTKTKKGGYSNPY